MFLTNHFPARSPDKIFALKGIQLVFLERLPTTVISTFVGSHPEFHWYRFLMKERQWLNPLYSAYRMLLCVPFMSLRNERCNELCFMGNAFGIRTVHKDMT
jgi:hypothetical protein